MVLALSFAIFVQAQELSIEESYLQESVEMMVLRERVEALDRDSKFAALEYIKQMIDDGNTGEEIHGLLQYLALEGIVNTIRSEGRVANNFPDVRVKSVDYLGDLQSKEAANTLLRVLQVDTEPSVVSAAVRSLARLGFNDSGYTLNAILYIFNRYDAAKPNNVLAMSVIDASNSFLQADSDTRTPQIYATLMYISTSPNYVRPVRDYASKILAGLYKAGGK
jgi:hypothetical protein